MRLIDADALKLTFCRECTLRDNGCPEQNGGECDVQAVYHIEHCTPTIDATPVKHGKWIDDKSTIVGDIIERYCSLCGQRMTSCIERLMPYCPHCGAKMDLEG